MSVLCAHCGQPIADTTPNRDGERFFHGACYALEFPPEHPTEWPRPPFHGVTAYSHDERVRDGLERP